VPRSLSKSQIDKLGERLAAAPAPAREDLEALAGLRESYAEAMRAVQSALRELGLESTSRPKTISTMVDKLRRDQRITLSRMQDIAGVRVTKPMTLAGQDTVVEEYSCPCRCFRLAPARQRPSRSTECWVSRHPRHCGCRRVPSRDPGENKPARSLGTSVRRPG
jgi:hypothetical protein